MPQPITPRISVVLCTYNGAAFLTEQLQSIWDQTLPPAELIAVDDCSTDHTMEVLETFASRYPQMVVVRNEQNLGYNKNFEKAMGLATCDLLAPADQDDIWHPQKLQKLVAQWPARCPMVYCISVPFRTEVPAQPRPNNLMNRIWGTQPRKLALFNTVAGHAMIIRRPLLAKAFPFPAHVYFDWWLAMVATCNGGTHLVPEVLVYQRLHAHNASQPALISRRQAFERERNIIGGNLPCFAQTPGMPLADQQFFQHLNQLWQAALQGKNQWALFWFLLRNRGQLYASKKRRFALVSQVKRSWQYAFRKHKTA